MPFQAVSVIGAGECSPEESRLAEEVGRLLALRGVTVVCGGLTGVTEAACKGAYEAGGMTVGLLPGSDARDANPYIKIPIPTGMGETRNVLVVKTGSAAIAVGGEYGTLSEIAFALKMGKKVIGLNTWELRKGGSVDKGILIANSPEEAVEMALASIGAQTSRSAL